MTAISVVPANAASCHPRLDHRVGRFDVDDLDGVARRGQAVEQLVRP